VESLGSATKRMLGPIKKCNTDQNCLNCNKYNEILRCRVVDTGLIYKEISVDSNHLKLCEETIDSSESELSMVSVINVLLQISKC
jgi:hypothetical protein